MSVVVVTGSRKLTESLFRLQIKACLTDTIRNLYPTVLFHGGATGPDAWAAEAFQPIQRCVRPERDDPYVSPAQALFLRNITMVKDAIHEAGLRHQPLVVVACWDGKSHGTWHAMEYVRSQAIPTVRIPVSLIEKAHAGS